MLRAARNRYQRVKLQVSESRDRFIITLSFLQDGGRLPSCICGAHFGKTHKEHLVVFILYDCAKLDLNRCSSFNSTKV